METGLEMKFATRGVTADKVYRSLVSRVAVPDVDSVESRVGKTSTQSWSSLM